VSEENTDIARLIPLLRHALGNVDLDLPPQVQTVFNVIIGSRPDLLVIVDVHGIVRFVSNACEHFFGWHFGELEGKPFETLIAPQDRQLYSQFFGQRIEPLIGQSFSEPVPLDLRFVREDPKTGVSFLRWMALRVASSDVLRDAGPDGGVLLFSLMDISHREAEEKRILQQLNFDALTGLPSRYNLLAQIEKHIASYQALGAEVPFHLVFFDLDRFKNVNDALGHRLGDQFLASLCQRLQSVFQDGQVFGRFGGDEFLLFLPAMQDLDEVSQLCLQALDLLREPLLVEGYTLSCGASFGIARYPNHGRSVDDLIQAADTAMYHVKSQGQGGCAVFDSSMSVERFSQLELEQELKEALIQGDFVAFYQPVVCLHSGKIKGVEALVRWNHQRLGLMEPAEFLPLAVRAGLMHDIDQLVQRQALQTVAGWHDEGVELHLSINCSAAQIESPDFLRQIQTLCRETGFAANKLNIELTEQTLVRHIEHAATNIQAARDQGIQIAIDDFGMGYSSLQYLREFPVDILKIDRSFIQDLYTEQDVATGVSLVDAIIAMAKGLKLTLVAEGVERPAQLKYLQAKDCDQGQGYLFAEACDAEQMRELLAKADFSSLVTWTDDSR
jgi:diguanylate cyclase (GGDEF)-like protein